MEETIIIYTKYYSEAVIEILDRFNLSIQIMCFSDYGKVLRAVSTTPNLRGIIFIEYKNKNKDYEKYKTILTVADDIAQSSKQPICVSILANTDLPRKFISEIKTSYIDIFFTKFLMFNTDLLRFEGLAAVIANSIGIASDSILLELDVDKDSLKYNFDSKEDFYTTAMKITVCPDSELNTFEEQTQRFPELDKLLKVRLFDSYDYYIDEYQNTILQSFLRLCKEKRLQRNPGSKIS